MGNRAMLFNVPFIPVAEYAQFLNDLKNRLYAVHFSLHDPALFDARVPFPRRDEEHLINLLKTLSHPRKYLLANSRFQQPDRYLAPDGLTHLIERLRQLKSASCLDGIIFSDPYLLFALSDAAPDLTACLEAVPSINFQIDSIQAIDAVQEIIEQSRFQPPQKILLDRTINRRPALLSTLVAAIRHRWPKTRIELLANEGCLNHCPFRLTHDALIAACNAGLDVDTFHMNHDLGCMRLLAETPHRILASPFIRPEDLFRYEGLVDIVKVCGRTLGKSFLMRTINAYLKEKYEGNLTDLLDASNWMAEKWEIRNNDLPGNYFDIVTNCNQDCRNCTNCSNLFQRCARPLPFNMKDLRGSS